MGKVADLINPNSVSDFFLCESRERGDLLTNLKLQKFLYYAQAWHLALKDQSLFAEDFQAWVHGPVLPSQYQRFKSCGWHPILVEVERPRLSLHSETFLNEIVDVFGIETATALEIMTHNELPWQEARQGLAPDQPSTAIIRKESMKEFYRRLNAKK
jgi:uncharacterized phage-associated protein